MSLTVSYVNGQGFDASLIDLDDWLRQSAAIKGSLAAAAMLAGQPQFIARAKTTDNSAASAVIDLTAQGVTFPAKTYRRLRVRSTAVNGTDSFVQEYEQLVYGNDGTTPKLIGSPRLLISRGQINGTVVDYGLLQYHGTTSGATVTDGADAPSGVTLGNFSSGVATLTVPNSRSTATMRVVAAHLSEDAGTVADTRLIQVRAATVTTFTVNTFDVQNASPAISSPNGVNNVDIEVFILPPASVAFAMATNNVTVTAGYNTTDNVYHDLEVFISRADTHLLAPD